MTNSVVRREQINIRTELSYESKADSKYVVSYIVDSKFSAIWVNLPRYPQTLNNSKAISQIFNIFRLQVLLDFYYFHNHTEKVA